MPRKKGGGGGAAKKDWRKLPAYKQAA